MKGKSLPTSCPSCQTSLSVRRLHCQKCDTHVEGTYVLPLLSRIGEDDQQFILNFVRCSGSLKDLAKQYGVSYPTVRNRLDNLIERLRDLENATKTLVEEESPDD